MFLLTVLLKKKSLFLEWTVCVLMFSILLIVMQLNIFVCRLMQDSDMTIE